MKMKVLIADADEKFRGELVAALAEKEELEIIGVAVDGKEALQLAGENQPDILVMDLLLPYCDGLSVLDMLPDCKVFVVTGFISDYILTALEERQIFGLRIKPCSAQSIVDWIVETLGRQRTAEPIPLPNILLRDVQRLRRRRQR